MSFKDKVIDALTVKDGQTDRELTNVIKSPSDHPSQVNQECRLLAAKGTINRKEDLVTGAIRNWLGVIKRVETPARNEPVASGEPNMLSEEDVKHHVAKWLGNNGWTPTVAWGKQRGIDIEAVRREERWVIEAKGCGSLQPMRVNYFIAMLGETLQRMDDAAARYSIALPNLAQFRGLWSRLPALAKQRTNITAIFVDVDGTITHEAD